MPEANVFSIKFIDLIKHYYAIKNKHNNNPDLSKEEMLNDYLHIPDFVIKDNKETISFSNVSELVSDIFKENHSYKDALTYIIDDIEYECFSNIYDKIFAFIDDIYSENLYDYSFKDQDISLLYKLYFSYFYYLFNDDKAFEKYKVSCNNYYLNYYKHKENTSQLFAALSRTKRNQLQKLLYNLSSNNKKERIPKSHSKNINNQSMQIRTKTYFCYILIFTLIDNNENLSKYIFNQKWENLEEIELSILLISLYFLVDGDNRFVHILFKMKFPCISKVFSELQLLINNTNNIIYCDNKDMDDVYIKVYALLKKLNKQIEATEPFPGFFDSIKKLSKN